MHYKLQLINKGVMFILLSGEIWR